MSTTSSKPGKDHPCFDLIDIMLNRNSIQVIEMLHGKELLFDELRQRLHNLSESTLMSTLYQLQQAGLVSDLTNDRSLNETRYTLTRIGVSALNPIFALHTWAKTHYEDAIDYAAAEASVKRFLMMHRSR